MSLSNKKVAKKAVTISRVLPDSKDVSANNSVINKSLLLIARSYIDDLRENVKRMIERKKQTKSN